MMQRLMMHYRRLSDAAMQMAYLQPPDTGVGEWTFEHTKVHDQFWMNLGAMIKQIQDDAPVGLCSYRDYEEWSHRWTTGRGNLTYAEVAIQVMQQINEVIEEIILPEQLRLAAVKAAIRLQLQVHEQVDEAFAAVV